MMPARRRAMRVLAASLGAALLGVAARPRKQVALIGSDLQLDAMFPPAFADWVIDPSVTPLVPSPDQKRVIERAYDQTLARTYRNGSSYQVMLSVAYGGRRDQSMDVHRPEICYPAQGLAVQRSPWNDAVEIDGTRLPIRRLVAGNAQRHEPVSYWLVIGHEVAGSSFEHRLATFKYGLTGRIVDGILVRVSSVDEDDARSFAMQNAFLRAMFAALSLENRKRLTGSLDT